MKDIIDERDIDALKEAIAAGIDLDARDALGETLLHYAASWGGAESVRVLLDAGADVNVLSHNGQTPLFNVVVCNGDAETAALLIAAGCNLNVKDWQGVTVLDVVISNGNVDVAKLLIDAGAEATEDAPVKLSEYESEEVDDDGDQSCGDDDNEEDDSPVWEGGISRMCEYKGYYLGNLSELLNVGNNDRLMFVHVENKAVSNEWSFVDECIVIYLKREGGEWKDICWPSVPDDDADPHFPEDWNMEEILDAVWNWNTITYTTRLNEDSEQVESTWEIEE